MDLPNEKLAKELYLRTGINKVAGNPRPEMAEVASNGYDDLDDLDVVHIRVLAWVYVNGITDVSFVSSCLEENENTVTNCLRDLTLCEYLKENNSGDSEPTKLGSDIVKQVGERMLRADIFNMKRYLEEYESIIKNLQQ